MFNNLIQQMMQQNLNFNNPLFAQAQKMVQGKNQEEILTLAKNICKEKGINFEEVYTQFQQMMKGM